MKAPIVIFVFLSVFGRASASNCKAFSPLANWQEMTYPRTSEGVRQSQRERYNSAIAAVRNLFRSYAAGENPSFSAKDCQIGDPGRKEFDFARGPVFFEESRSVLLETGDSSAFRLVSLMDQRFGIGGAPPVRFVIESRNQQDPTFNAGVARVSKAFFASLSEIPHLHWKIVFVHEVAHLVDDGLDSAVNVWQNPDLRAKALEDADRLSKAGAGMAQFATPSLDLWLKAGLDRGFLAEYRAWVVTAEIYKSLRTQGLQSELEWMKGLVQLNESFFDSQKRVFRALDGGFVDPSDGIFSNPWVAKRLVDIRQNLRKELESKPPPLGALQQVFDGPP